jgi:hypothetical protein
MFKNIQFFQNAEVNFEWFLTAEPGTVRRAWARMGTHDLRK